MRDANFILLLSVTFVVFLAIAVYAPAGIRHFVRKTRVAPPHRALLVALRVWFGVLAAGTLVLVLLQMRMLGGAR